MPPLLTGCCMGTDAAIVAGGYTGTVDATSGWAVPASTAEWTSLLAGSGLANPSLLWLCQEAAGNLADSIGSGTGAKGGAPTYQNAVSGWSRKAVICRNSAADIFDYGSWPAASSLVLAIVNFPASDSEATPNIVTFGGVFGAQVGCYLQTSSNPTKVRLFTHGDTGTNGTNNTTGVHPLIVQVNDTAGTAVVQTDLETVSASTAVDSYGDLFIGGNNVKSWNAGGQGYLYLAAWTGVGAEFSVGNRATLLSLIKNGH